MSEQDKIITTETLSHFKAKQDIENANKFKSKDDASDLKGAVRYDAAQVLTEEQKAQARANIGAGTGDGTGSAEGAVLYNAEQALSTEEQARARSNIGAGTSNFDGDYNSLSNRTHYKEGINIEWDGYINDKKYVDCQGGNAYFVRVQDTPIVDTNAIIGAEVRYYGNTEQVSTIIPVGDKGSSYVLSSDGSTPVIFNCLAPETLTMFGVEATFEYTGVYFIGVFENGIETVATFRTEYVSSPIIYHKLEDGYIPDSIPRLDENGKLSIDNIPDLGFYDEIVEGYFNSSDNLFYEEAEFTTLITGESGKIYVDLTENNSYRFSGSIFIRINPPEYRIATNADIEALFA